MFLVKLQTYYPSSFNNEDQNDHHLIPSSKQVTIPAYYAYRLIDALTKILPARDTLEEPEPFFGTDFTKPRGVNVTYPNDDTQQEVIYLQ